MSCSNCYQCAACGEWRPEIDFDTYQAETKKTAIYRERSIGIDPIEYTALGLVEEAGEVAGKIKKFYRDNTGYTETREMVKKELGDVLWYLSEHAAIWGLALSEVAQANVEKLASRRARGTVHGSGDDR